MQKNTYYINLIQMSTTTSSSIYFSLQKHLLQYVNKQTNNFKNNYYCERSFLKETTLK